MELIIVFLGGTPPGKFSFKKPGAIHHARWLAKALYTLKMYLFRDQIELPKLDLEGLKEICLFIISAYQFYWFTANKPHLAASNDLKFIQTLSSSKVICSKICEAALDKISSHFTYLSEGLIAMALFDDDLPVETKNKIRHAMKIKNTPLVSSENNLAVLDLSNKQKIKSLSLDNFASKNSLEFFKILGIPTKFIEVDCKYWSSREDFIKASRIVKKLPVVNDNAERAVALASTFNESITKDENQRQYLLQVVHDNRKKLPDCKKNTLQTFFSSH